MVFTHGGATGDIIFSLPTIRAMGGGELYITKYDEQRANSIKKLIEVQPYITKVEVVGQAPEGAINLNLFRHYAGHHQNLVLAHFKGQDFPVDETWIDGWLTLPDLHPMDSRRMLIDIMQMPPNLILNEKAKRGYCVINRTTNYADPNFDWGKEVEYLKTLTDNVFFIGYEQEYKIFNEKWPGTEYYDCDFLLAAYLIQHAVMFTGCYSAMSTIAMGLGREYRMEQAPGHTCSSLNQPRETVINV
jgi:hypothetical protein